MRLAAVGGNRPPITLMLTCPSWRALGNTLLCHRSLSADAYHSNPVSKSSTKQSSCKHTWLAACFPS